MQLPERYQDAEWRNTTASFCPDRQRVGVSFSMKDYGYVVRLALDLDSARNLVETLLSAIGQAIATQSGRTD